MSESSNRKSETEKNVKDHKHLTATRETSEEIQKKISIIKTSEEKGQIEK